MSAELWGNVDPINTALLLGVIVFLWRLSSELRRDIADLRERMAKLEGAMDGFTKGI